MYSNVLRIEMPQRRRAQGAKDPLRNGTGPGAHQDALTRVQLWNGVIIGSLLEAVEARPLSVHVEADAAGEVDRPFGGLALQHRGQTTDHHHARKIPSVPATRM